MQYFTPMELTRADSDTSRHWRYLPILSRLDRLRHVWGRPIHIISLYREESWAHSKYIAVDVHCKIINKSEALKFILHARGEGFNGLGVYVNDAGYYSFHLDLRHELATWRAEEAEDGWKYSKLEVL